MKEHLGNIYGGYGGYDYAMVAVAVAVELYQHC